MENVTLEQPDHDECGIEVKQELEEDPLAGQPNFDTTLWTYEVPTFYLPFSNFVLDDVIFYLFNVIC